MEATKRCPYCAEEILAAASKCKHCGSDITMGAYRRSAVQADPVGERSLGFIRYGGAAFIVVVILAGT